MKALRHLLAAVFVAAAAFTALTVPAHAQSNWTAWFYSPTDGVVWHVSSEGALLNNYVLPTLMGHDRYSRTITLSPDGGRMAYAVYSTDMRTTQLLVTDANSGEIIATWTPPHTVIGDSFDLGGVVFNRMGTALAYGYLAEPEGWHLIDLSVDTATVLFDISSGDAPALSLGLSERDYSVPVPQFYGSAEVLFTVVAYGTEGQLVYPSYRWSLLTESLASTTAYPSLNADTRLLNGEAVMAGYDERLPDRLDMLMFPSQNNAVMVYDPAALGIFPVIANEAWSFRSAHFIQGGERIIAPAELLDDGTRLYPVVERTGEIAGYAPVFLPGNFGFAGIQDGFVYFSQETPAPEFTLFEVNTRTAIDSGRRVWTGSSPNFVELVWVGPVSDQEALAVGPWVTLAPPISAGSASIAPEAVTTPGAVPGELRIGGRAIINTTEGDRLNMRSGPGIGFDRVARVANGTAVTVLEGPRSADGFIWWRIELADGTSGWVVQSADNVRTLLPQG